MNREKERGALLAGLPPPPLPECMVEETVAGAVSLANYLTAAIGRIATRQKLEAGFERSWLVSNPPPRNPQGIIFGSPSKKEEVLEGSRSRRAERVVAQTDPPPRPTAVEEVEVPTEVVVGVAVEAPKRTPTPPITPQNQTPKSGGHHGPT